MIPFFTDQLIQRLSETHAHIIGSSGRGKSKLLEWIARELLKRRRPLAIFDWHGKLAQDVIDFLAYIGHKPVMILQPKEKDWILPVNPFIPPEGTDLSEHVAYCIAALIRPWGTKSTDATPTLEKTLRMVFWYCAEAKETLPNAARLISLPESKLRERAIQLIQDSDIRGKWMALNAKKDDKFLSDVNSTDNRFTRFLGSQAIKRHIAFKEGNVDFEQVLANGTVFIADFSKLPEEEARTFATLLLWDFFRSALLRIDKRPKPYFLLLDEFQHYLTPDIAQSFEEGRKAGLRLVVAHQQFGQLSDAARIEDSIFTNAQMSFAFGALSTESAAKWAKEHMLDQLHRLPDRYVSVEERLLNLAEILKAQAKQKCFVKLPDETAFEWDVPLVEEFHPRDSRKLPWLDACRSTFKVRTQADADSELAIAHAPLAGKVRTNRHTPKL